MNWVFVATLVCGASVMTSCSSNDDNPAQSDLNLSEKIIGKWMVAELDGQACPTNLKTVLTFVSPTKAYGSLSDYYSLSWNVRVLADVAIDGNKMSVVNQDGNSKNVLDCTVLSISDTEMLMSSDWNVYVNCQSVQHEVYNKERYVRIASDYEDAILGMWEGRSTGTEGSEFDDGESHRWEYLADGTFHYYHKVDGQWQLSDDVLHDYFVDGKGREVTDMVEGVQSCYDSHTEEHKNTDEFMEPLVNGNIDGRIKEGDVVIFFNFRSDRAKELTTVLTQQDMPEQGMTTIANLQYYCMTPYDDSFTGVHILFPKDNLENTLGEYIASMGLKQLHIAETEKYAHVTSFINGGREEPFPGEDRILVASPKVATYDLKPEMSAFEVKDKLVEALKTDQYDWIVVNFANADMVGHTGVYTAIQTAVKTIDQCLNEVVETAKAMGYETIITADHGNADHAINADGSPNTTHSTNPVPFIYVTTNKNATVQSGALADVAPSVLHILGLQQPKEMTGQCLIKK